MKVLHFMLDSPFCASAWDLFDQAAPGCNEAVMESAPPVLRHTARCAPRRVSRRDLFSSAFLRSLAGYPLVVVHYLDEFRARMVLRAPRGTNFLWMGWGGDYYPFLRVRQLDPATARARCMAMLRPSAWKAEASALARRFCIADLLLRPRRLFERIRHFAPVLPGDYDLARERIGGDFPAFREWTYATLEDYLLPDPSLRADGPNLLLGHNATWENNHLEALDLLPRPLPPEMKVIVPLSYGNAACREFVRAEGVRRLGSVFAPLLDFLPLDDYRARLATCGVAVMNHLRQQATGNVVALLAMGARVYLHPRGPLLPFLRGLGAVVFGSDQIATQGLSPLSEAERVRNLKAVRERWGREAVQARTRRLLAEIAPNFADRGASV